MRIENDELRTKSLNEAAAILTAGALYSAIEWLNKNDAEFIFSRNNFDIAYFCRVYFTDSPLPCRTLLSNYSYLKALLKNSLYERQMKNERDETRNRRR